MKNILLVKEALKITENICKFIKWRLGGLIPLIHKINISNLLTKTGFKYLIIYFQAFFHKKPV